MLIVDNVKLCKYYDSHQLPDQYTMWSGRRDSNPRQPAWKAGTLATELRPHIVNMVVGEGFEPSKT